MSYNDPRYNRDYSDYPANLQRDPHDYDYRNVTSASHAHPYVEDEVYAPKAQFSNHAAHDYSGIHDYSKTTHPTQPSYYPAELNQYDAYNAEPYKHQDPHYGYDGYDGYDDVPMKKLAPKTTYPPTDYHENEVSLQSRENNTAPAQSERTVPNFATSNSAANEPALTLFSQSKDGYARFDEDNIKPKNRRRFMGACCGCCPVWLRFVCCGFLVVIIGLGIAAGVIAATFKKPQIEFKGVLPQGNGFSRGENNSVVIDLKLQVHINNPNILGATFWLIKADAFYPLDTSHDIFIGTGNQTDVTISAHYDDHILFPLSLTFDLKKEEYKKVAWDFAGRCGLTNGQQPQQLTVKYNLNLNIKILFINISPTIEDHAKFTCPKELNNPELGKMLTDSFSA
ncbi:uncharacterized protein VTP21DRAFT_8655 [Calcarisporiella thermophila]|uniref:uncharacterized protein n=1 Tax=Calcarisporiella thermophila TaxID=911321 RepID=UPI003742EDCD